MGPHTTLLFEPVKRVSKSGLAGQAGPVLISYVAGLTRLNFAVATGFEPAIFRSTGGCVDHYTTRPNYGGLPSARQADAPPIGGQV